MSENRSVKDKIIFAATKLMAKKGYAATSLQEIADSVGLRKQSLLYYFPNKASLRMGVLESIFSYWKNEVPRALVEAATGESRFESALNVVINFFIEDSNRARLVIREVLDRPQEVRSLIREHFHPWLGLITSYISKGKAHGEVVPDIDPEAYLVHCIIVSVSVMATCNVFHEFFPTAGESEPESRDRLINEMKRILKISMFGTEKH